MGALTPPSRPFNGLLDEVRIYSRALSAAEVASRYLDTSGGPVAEWRLEEGIGTVAHDTSGQVSHGNMLPNPNGPTWSTGKWGQGLQFDGTNDYVNAGSGSSLNITGALTVEYWMKPTTLQETGGVNKYDLNNQRSWTVYPRNDGAVVFRVSSDGTANTLVDAATSANAYSSGAWTHVVATYTPATSMKIYVNGVESASLTTGVPAALYAAPAVPVFIGSYGQSNGTPQTVFNGVLDELRIYSRALSASEVQARYLAQPESEDTLHYYLGGKEVAFKKGGTLYYPLQDHLGSSAVVTNSAGALVESTAYYPYGATRTGAITTTEEKFTGQRLDSTGLYFYNARYYDPAIGRFISADPITHSQPLPIGQTIEALTVSYAGPWAKGPGREPNTGSVPSTINPQQHNRYSYALNNPLRYVDPQGNQAEAAATFARVVVIAGGGLALMTGAGEVILIGVGVVAAGVVLSVTAKKVWNRFFGKKEAKGGETNSPTGPGKSKRDELLDKAVNEDLRNAIDHLYEPGAKVGDGGTAAAIREEFRTGQQVGEKWHFQKGANYMKYLEDILSKDLSPSDRSIAESLYKDLMDAFLSGVKP